MNALPGGPGQVCPAAGIQVVSPVSGTFAIGNGKDGRDGIGGPGGGNVAYQKSQDDEGAIGSSAHPMVWTLPLPRGNRVVFAKALATGPVFVDCTLMTHSDTIVIPPSAEVDSIDVRPDRGPLATVLAGTSVTDDDNLTGVDLLCGSMDGPASVGRIKSSPCRSPPC